MTLRDTADQIIRASLRAVQPDAAVQRALQEFSCAGRVVLIAIGKAAWAMANAAWDTLSTRITSGAVITKYGHSRGPIGPLQIFEAGHPVPDEAGLRAAQAALELTRGLREEDCVLFLISGGGSALFESPLVPLAELEDITGQLLSCGADIVEINTIRKRLSAVKGGRFALHCRPALQGRTAARAPRRWPSCGNTGCACLTGRWPSCRQKRRKHCRTQSPA